jgi:hypothetical protein
MPQPNSHAIGLVERAASGDDIVVVVATHHAIRNVLDALVVAARQANLGITRAEYANGRERLRFASGAEVTLTTHAQADRHLMGRRPHLVHAEGGIAYGTLVRLQAAGVEVRLS